MSALRLRVLKRHTSLEAVSFEDFFNAELLDKHGQPDLNLSVFDVDIDQLVRTHAEFVVSFLSPDPKKTRGGLCLDGCSADFDPRPDPADKILFSYSRDRHLELRFLRGAEVRVLAEQVYRERTERERSTTHGEVVAYGQARLAERDAEWSVACVTRPKWDKALKK